jgi:hypothetical protein
MENMKLVDASLDGTVTYEMIITPNFSNLNSTQSFSIVSLEKLTRIQMSCMAAQQASSLTCQRLQHYVL